MLKAKDKFTIAVTVMCSAILILAVACSIMFAAFQASKQGTTTISFHEGITIDVSGIDGNGLWYYNNTGSTTGGFTMTSGAVLNGLALSPISVTVTKGASEQIPCFVRIYAVITTTSTTANLTNFTLGSAVTTDETRLQAENDFFASIANTKKQSIAGTIQINDLNSATTLLNALSVFSVTEGGEPSAFNGEQVQAYFRIYASTTDGQWGQGYTYSFSTGN